jgi:DNA-binding CsgD family transcriptional regulator/PAS domain-containing protein
MVNTSSIRSVAPNLRKYSATKGLVTAVEAIYDAALDPLRWPKALEATAACMGDAGAILLWHRDNGSFDSIASPSLLGAQKDWEQEGRNGNEFRSLSTVERAYFFSGVAFTDKHLFSDNEIRTNSSYAKFQVRHGLGWFAAVAVSPDPDNNVVFSVHRNAKKRAPYSDDELANVARVGRHIQKSLRLSVRLLNSELQTIGLGDALSRVGIGVFILDSAGHVVFINQVGQSLVGEGLALGHDRILVGAGPASSALEVAIKQAIRPIPENFEREPKPIVIHCEKTDRPLALYVLPLSPLMHPATQFLPHARAVVLAIVRNAGDARAPDPALIRDVLGLTLGEARLAAQIGSGLAPRKAAEKLGITEETARTVLKHVFSKTGVSRQSELVSLLSRMVLR